MGHRRRLHPRHKGHVVGMAQSVDLVGGDGVRILEDFDHFGVA